MAVSFLTGRIVYISEQAGVLLRCKRDVFRGTRFSELLAPQDVGVFYGSTTPSRLPTWGPGTSTGEVPKCLGEDEQSPEATAVRGQGTQAFPRWDFLSPGRGCGAVLTALLVCLRFRPQGLHPGEVCLLSYQVGGGRGSRPLPPPIPPPFFARSAMTLSWRVGGSSLIISNAPFSSLLEGVLTGIQGLGTSHSA